MGAITGLVAVYTTTEKLKITDLYRFLVHDDHVTDGQLRSYITPGAVWDTNALFSRCTFEYIAYNIITSKLVYLKDFWHTDLPEIQKEGDIYRRLHDAEVPNIPALGPAGDVPLSPDCKHIPSCCATDEDSRLLEGVRRSW
jgi:hypothetical protein